MIRTAGKEDIPYILEITRACSAHMIRKGIYQWNEEYPSVAAFTRDVDRQELFVLELKSGIVGCIVISTFMDEVYHPVKWLTPNTDNNIYIHRLAIHPDFQRMGYAGRLMDYAENFAKLKQFDSIRLDTFSKNPGNQRFYEDRGYIRLEDIYFPDQSEYPFYCYEKPIL